MLGPIDVVLVTENTVVGAMSALYSLISPHHSSLISIPLSLSLLLQISRLSGVPDAHAGTRNRGQLDGSGETLVTLRVIVLEADLELDGLEEVSLLLVQRVLEKLLHVLAHAG
jgi:hypothetical protein